MGMAPTSTITRRAIERQLLPGSGFTIEPGLYFPTFGVRTEINVVILGTEARVSGPRQAAITPLAH